MSACLPGQGGSSPSAAASASRSAAAPSSAPPATPTPAPTPTPAAVVYTVKSGDTLSAIAGANKTSVEAIVKANNLTDPDKIQEGQKLVMPVEAVAPSASSSGAPPAASAAAGLPPAASKPPPP